MRLSLQHISIGALALLVLVAAGCSEEEVSEPPEQTETDEQPQAERPLEPQPDPFNGSPTFIDAVRFDYGPKGPDDDLRDTPVFSNIPRLELARFEMTLVPGDAEAGIGPFYLSTTEVAAEMFFPWATGDGLTSEAWRHWRSLDLHPSQITRDVLDYGPPDRPAMSMSRTVAEHYCAWVSEQTGRNYRLPTNAEWEHALHLGGGVPADREALLRQATLADNALGLDQPPFVERPSAVASREPNALGIYDMLGNAAEWVSGTGDEHVVRGGHYVLPASELDAEWRAVEDVEAWNSSAPNIYPGYDRPIWFSDFHFTGIRLACDGDEAPADAPSDALPISSEPPAQAP